MHAPERASWTGPVPKPTAVLLLQIVGVVLLVIVAAIVGLGFLLHWEEAAKIWILPVVYVGLTAPFALLSGVSRPFGLVAGMVALALMIPMLPVGTVVAAVVGFFGIKNRDHVRDYYAQRVVRP